VGIDKTVERTVNGLRVGSDAAVARAVPAAANESKSTFVGHRRRTGNRVVVDALIDIGTQSVDAPVHPLQLWKMPTGMQPTFDLNSDDSDPADAGQGAAGLDHMQSLEWLEWDAAEPAALQAVVPEVSRTQQPPGPSAGPPTADGKPAWRIAGRTP